MARETLKLQGIQRNRKQRKFDPGSANEMINIRPRDGVWEVIGDKKVYDTIEAYTPKRILAYHAMKDVHNIIFLSDNKVVSKSKDGGYSELIAITSDSVAAETINNILVLSMEDSFLYFVWKEEAYIQITTLFEDFHVRKMGWEVGPMPDGGEGQEFSAVPDKELDWDFTPNHLCVQSEIAHLPKPAGFRFYPLHNIATFETELDIWDNLEGSVGMALEVIEQAHFAGIPVGPVNLVFTIELFDGTEIAHTAPVRTVFSDLFVSRRSAANKYLFSVVKDGADRKLIWLRVHGIPLADDFDGIIKGIRVYISRPCGFIDSRKWLTTGPLSAQAQNQPFISTGRNYYSNEGGGVGYIVRANWAEPDQRPINLSSESSPPAADSYAVSGGGFRYDEPLYLVAKIGYADMRKDAPIGVSFEDISNDKIVTYDPLPADNFSHHKLTASFATAYNGRLFVANTTTEFSAPKHPVIHGNLKRYSTPGVVTDEATEKPYGSLVIKVSRSSVGAVLGEEVLGYWNGTWYSPIPLPLESATHDIVLQVILSTDYGDLVVTSPKFSARGMAEVFLSGWYTYPDSRAKTLRVYSKSRKDGAQFPPLSYTIREFPMTASDTHNLSYASISLSSDHPSVGSTLNPPEPSNAVLNDINRVQASALNNPFVFPAVNSYRVGSSEVIGLQTINNAISEGQFGEYPMIAFTKSGVWAMTIAEGERLISNIVPLANEICTNPDSITAVRKGIAFVTAEGLKIISGSKTVNISEIVRGNPGTKLKDGAVMQKILDSSGYSHLIADVDFDQYIQGAKIGYDDYHEELIISNPSKHYSYLFNLETNAWYCASVRFDGFIAKFPYLFGFDGRDVYATNQEDRRPKNALYISNEINFANVYSKFEQMLARGNFGRCRAMVFGTTDLENWKLLSIVTTPGGFDMRLPRGFYTCKSFVIVLDGTFERDSYLEEFDVETKHRYGRRLR